MIPKLNSYDLPILKVSNFFCCIFCTTTYEHEFLSTKKKKIHTTVN